MFAIFFKREAFNKWVGEVHFTEEILIHEFNSSRAIERFLINFFSPYTTCKRFQFILASCSSFFWEILQSRSALIDFFPQIRKRFCIHSESDRKEFRISYHEETEKMPLIYRVGNFHARCLGQINSIFGGIEQRKI